MDKWRAWRINHEQQLIRRFAAILEERRLVMECDLAFDRRRGGAKPLKHARPGRHAAMTSNGPRVVSYIPRSRAAGWRAAPSSPGLKNIEKSYTYVECSWLLDSPVQPTRSYVVNNYLVTTLGNIMA